MAQLAIRRQSKLTNTDKMQQMLAANINLQINPIDQGKSQIDLNVSKVNFAEDMFSSDQQFDETDELNESQKAIKEFKQQWKSPDGRKKIYEDIL